MRKKWILTACFLAMSSALGAAEPTTLSGFIEKQSGVPAGEGEVTVRIQRNRRLSLERVATTDRRGYFEFNDLPEGEYRLQIKQDGYRPVLTYLKVHCDRTSHQRFSIRLEPVSH